LGFYSTDQKHLVVLLPGNPSLATTSNRKRDQGNGHRRKAHLWCFGPLQSDTDGGFPEPDHLTMDAAGNFYGTARAGGKLVQKNGRGFNSFGVVFEILGAGEPAP
jgi:hypothetical protein